MYWYYNVFFSFLFVCIHTISSRNKALIFNFNNIAGVKVNLDNLVDAMKDQYLKFPVVLVGKKFKKHIDIIYCKLLNVFK